MLGLAVVSSSTLAGADAVGARNEKEVSLAFDFSKNSTRPTVARPYVVVVRVLPSGSQGFISLVAWNGGSLRPSCAPVAIKAAAVSCTLVVPTAGLWRLEAFYQMTRRGVIAENSSTTIRVAAHA